jgi:ribonuclease-3 family protein
MIENDFLKLNTRNDSHKAIMHSPAQLAYVGDAVYEILVRSHIIKNYDVNVHKMHKHTIRFVKAKSQAYLVRQLDCVFTEEEKRIVKRGRNAKVTSLPKNAELMDYRYATGFEALFGYLYLSDELDRLQELFLKVVEIINKKDENNEIDRR